LVIFVTDKPTDWRALCAELVDGWVEGCDIAGPMARARTALAQPEPEGDGLFHWRNLGDGKPVQVRECPMCGIAPANVDDCGRFGDPVCPYFGVGEPEPERPTASDVTELFYRHMGEGSEVGFENAIAEALARWARPTIKPVPVAERLPEAEDCDAEGKCWFIDSRDLIPNWFLDKPVNREDASWIGYTHWLPHHALPVPATH
jgi:hypothetical protein